MPGGEKALAYKTREACEHSSSRGIREPPVLACFHVLQMHHAALALCEWQSICSWHVHLAFGAASSSAGASFSYRIGFLLLLQQQPIRLARMSARQLSAHYKPYTLKQHHTGPIQVVILTDEALLCVVRQYQCAVLLCMRLSLQAGRTACTLTTRQSVTSQSGKACLPT